MIPSSHSTPDSASLSDMEKVQLEKDDLKTGSEDQHTAASTRPVHESLDEHSQLTPEINVSDWNGPDDPDNPYNWSKGRRLHHAIAPALLGFAV